MKLDTAVNEQRPEVANHRGIVLHHQNERTHTALIIRRKLLKLAWEVIAYPLSIPNVVTSDYNLFESHF